MRVAVNLRRGPSSGFSLSFDFEPIIGHFGTAGHFEPLIRRSGLAHFMLIRFELSPLSCSLSTNARRMLRAVAPRRRTCIALALIATVNLSLAQIDTLKLSPDELFAIARQKAFAGHRDEARSLCRTILAKYPSYLDVRTLLARTYAWDGNYGEARAELSKVLIVSPTNRDALSALLDVELWGRKFDSAVEVASQGLRAYPSDENFLFKKAQALNGLGRDTEALALLAKLEDINPSHPGAATLRQQIKRGALQNGAGFRYATDRFSEAYGAMHYAHAQLSRRTPLGIAFARLNFSRRFGREGVQPEFELYPTLAAGVYAYLDYGYSSSTLFPKHRVGAEFHSKLPLSLEASLGMRHLFFNPSQSVTIYTGSLGLYYKSIWISLRPYLTPDDAGLSTSTTMMARWYQEDVDNFLMLRGGFGFAADERSMQSSAGFGGKEVFYLKAQTAGVGWQRSLGAHLLFFVTVDVTNQELSARAGEYVTMYSISIELRARF